MQSWDRLLRALGEAAPRLGLRPPATETELVSTEVMLGTRFPPDFRSWLAISNGQEPGALSILPSGGWFHSHDQIVAKWSFERGFDLDDYDDIEETHDHERVRSFVFHPKRIAVAGWYDTEGDATMLDFVPGPSGTPGQLMTYVSECDFEVIANSLSGYFTRVAELLEAAKLAPLMVDDRHEMLMPPGYDGIRWEWLARGDRKPRP